MRFTARKEDIYTPDYILKHVSQEDIMSKYLGIKVVYDGPVKNPLRKDNNPTCTFKWIKDSKGMPKLRFNDWSGWMGDKSKDCFDVVCIKFGCDFNTALKKIASDFRLSDGIEDIQPLNLFDLPANYSPTGVNIKVQIQDFTTSDRQYLYKYGINRAICEKYNVFSLSHVWINNQLFYIQTKSNAYDDPVLGYYFGTVDGIERWKIYWYKRTHDRFRCNTDIVAGLRQLKATGPALVITKSLKDVMALDVYNVPAIAPQSESHSIDPSIIYDLKIRYGRIFSLYDFDYTGVRYSKKLRNEHAITPLFLTNGRYNTMDFGAKDISDYVSNYGVAETRHMINHVMKKFGLYDGVKHNPYIFA